MSSFNSISDILPITFTYLRDHFTSREGENGTRVSCIWSLLCTSNVHFNSTINTSEEREREGEGGGGGYEEGKERVREEEEDKIKNFFTSTMNRGERGK